jgi:hypothetical protein
MHMQQKSAGKLVLDASDHDLEDAAQILPLCDRPRDLIQ